MKRSAPVVGVLLAFAITVAGTRPAAVLAQQVRTPISDREFWRLVTDLSEEGGRFAQQLMSNEDSAQFVIPRLGELTQPGGVYIGVGAEQNFTYFVTLQPRLAFLVDIRRDNMLELLMYKALFELSVDRADFISRLFSRPRPANLRPDATVPALFEAFAPQPDDRTLFDRTAREVVTNLTGTHAFPLSDIDLDTLTKMLNMFSVLGPDNLKGYGDRTNPTFAQLMAAKDLAGRQQGFLASEANYSTVRMLEQQNLVIPVVGDFAGDRALKGIGNYLRQRDAIVNVFYVSNVERYLFEQGDHGKVFYANVEALPTGSSSLFIRSVTTDISQRLGIPIPEGPERWRTFIFSLEESVAGVRSGRVATYRDLFEVGRR